MRFALAVYLHRVALGANYAPHTRGRRYVKNVLAVFGFGNFPIINCVCARNMSFVGNFLTRDVVTCGGYKHAEFYGGNSFAANQRLVLARRKGKRISYSAILAGFVAACNSYCRACVHRKVGYGYAFGFSVNETRHKNGQ